MIWQENVQTIAMVTRLKEGDKVKCIRYWPRDTKDSPVYGDIRLSMTSEDTFPYWTKRSLIVIKGNETRTLTQFHFTSWPDKDVPKHKSQLLRFIKEVQGHHGSSSSPLLIHCSAGVGRTGVVIGIDSIVSRAKQTGMVEVFNFVASMREKRPHMVQTPEQYAFLYEAVLEDLLWEDTEIPLSQFVERIRELQENPAEGATNRSLLAGQFENLQILCPEPPETDVRSGKMAENQSKNRYGNLLPLQRNRVMLNDPDEDYINASFVQGAHYSFITTQMPLPNTVTAFLSMILTYRPTCVIMLNGIDESCAKYWPDEDQDTAFFGSFAVSTLDETEYDDMVVRTINVQLTSSELNHVVRQLQFRSWPTDMRAQATTGRRAAEGALLRLIGDAKRQSEVDGNLPLLVHCLSGVGRTGVFCVTMECLAQISEGTTVDVFHTVKMLRADRTHFVQTEEEYAFIHDVVAEYLRAIDYEQSGSPETTSDEPFYGNVAIGYSGGGPEAAPSSSEWPEAHPPPPAQNTIYQNVEIAEV
ncbi:receptor-type tyrosine-protein phosphatase alpha-like [Diadema setosum]|uniref:receptor-type tyrosine-protein phosphatase alpha-like n=1 Tax=Diadema setosum TaxID=31175 RepID=UPI003B3B9E0A